MITFCIINGLMEKLFMKNVTKKYFLNLEIVTNKRMLNKKDIQVE